MGKIRSNLGGRRAGQGTRSWAVPPSWGQCRGRPLRPEAESVLPQASGLWGTPKPSQKSSNQRPEVISHSRKGQLSTVWTAKAL